MLPDISHGGCDDGSLEYRIWLTKKQMGAGKHLSRSLSVEGSREAHGSVRRVQEHVRVETGHRMDVDELVGGFVERGKKVVVMVCGPGAFSDEVRKAAVKAAKNGYLVDLIEESFAW
jgi:hypothetical protein